MSESTTETTGWWRLLLRPGRFAVLVLVLVLAAGAGYLGFRAFTLSRQATSLSAERALLLRDGAADAVSLTTYDYRDLPASFAAVATAATGSFGERYRAAGQQRSAQLRADRSVSRGTVSGVGIQDETFDRSATVLVLVNQSITNTSALQPTVQRSALRITLEKSGDRWLIGNLVLL
jgi:Mce-associated membrane protein